MQSGKLRKLDELSSNDDLKTIDLFTKVWGAGPTTAQNWVRLGYKTLDDLKSDFNECAAVLSPADISSAKYIFLGRRRT